jgi:hypothetical protein
MLTSRRFPNRVFAAYNRFTDQIHRPADYPVNTPVIFHRKEIFKRPQNPARMPPDSNHLNPCFIVICRSADAKTAFQSNPYKDSRAERTL